MATQPLGLSGRPAGRNPGSHHVVVIFGPFDGGYSTFSFVSIWNIVRLDSLRRRSLGRGGKTAASQLENISWLGCRVCSSRLGWFSASAAYSGRQSNSVFRGTMDTPPGLVCPPHGKVFPL